MPSLLGLAAGLLQTASELSEAERQALDGVVPSTDAATLQAVRAAIRAGHDPLGVAYCDINSPEKRRDRGQTFTPDYVITGMLAWARRQRKVVSRVVDPGAGTGRYTLAALRALPKAKAVAVEFDPVVAILLRATLDAAGLSSRCEVVVGDYRDLKLPKARGATLFVGNPPYVRHHDISAEWKDWYSRTLKAYGHEGSQLAGLHLHFFLKTLELAQPGDVGCFITAAEWLDVNYGKALRQLLTNGLGGKDVFIVKPELEVFDDALVSAAITGFCPGAKRTELTFSTVTTASQLQMLERGEPVELETAKHEQKWTVFINGGRQERRPGYIELGDVFRVSRGQVTGLNKVWVMGAQTPPVPARFLVPAITDSTDITRATGHVIANASSLKQVISLPRELDLLPFDEAQEIKAFLDWAQAHGAHETYIAKHRKPWWSVSFGSKAPPIVMTYMGRRPPVFALNEAGAQLINVAHGLYPKRPLSLQQLQLLVQWLNENVSQDSGRVYAGGLTKFEPSEAMRLLIPDPDTLSAHGYSNH